MKLSTESHSLIELAINDAITIYTNQKEQSVVTDIHLQPNSDSGEFIIFNDNDEELSKVIIEEWVESKEEDFLSETEKLLRSILKQMDDKELLNMPALIKPYSFVLIDEDKETVTDLLLKDDDTVLLGEDLLKGLDDELDDFLEKLLKE